MILSFRYFVIFLNLFITEIIIALFIKQPFIRYVFGDFLIVIMLYCFIKGFTKLTNFYAALSVLIFAYVIEFLQLSNLLQVLNLNNNTLANLIMGNTFEITDLVAYTLGIFFVLIIEKVVVNNKSND